MTVEDGPVERSPLLDAEAPLTDESKGWDKNAMLTAGLIATFLCIGSIGEVFKMISSVRLIELGICREHYLLHDPSVIGSDKRVPEALCKLPNIQQELAHLRGSIGALEALVGLLLTIPYGLLINRVGERLLGVINIGGWALSSGWLTLVCYFWETFPISAVVYSPLFRTIGGSTPVMSSLVFSILAKHVPHENRSVCFFVLGAVQLMTEIFAMMVAAALVDHQYLFTPLISAFPIAMVVPFIMLSIPSEKKVPTEDVDCNEPAPTFGESIRKSLGLMSQVLHNGNVLLLLAAVPIAYLRIPIAELWLQYIPKKFDVSLGTASRVVTITLVESIILLIVVLPAIKEIAQLKFKMHSNHVDLRIVQFGFLVLSIGCLTMAFVQRVAPFIVGLLVFTLGVSTRPALQSVLTDLVTREQIAVMYTIAAVGDGIGAATGSLVLNRAFAIAIGWGDAVWLGLPFMIAAGCYGVGFGATSFAGHSGLKKKSGGE